MKPRDGVPIENRVILISLFWLAPSISTLLPETPAMKPTCPDVGVHLITPIAPTIGRPTARASPDGPPSRDVNARRSRAIRLGAALAKLEGNFAGVRP